MQIKVHADLGENIMTACQAVSMADLKPLAATGSSDDQGRPAQLAATGQVGSTKTVPTASKF